MSEGYIPAAGTIGWIDLTVENAEEVRDFYQAVVGWKPEPVSMGEYDDFNMTEPESGNPIAGVCHHRGTNTGIPPQWMIYITVDDLDARVAKVSELGGEVIYGPKDMGSHGRFCILRDPAGAVAGLFQSA